MRVARLGFGVDGTGAGPPKLIGGLPPFTAGVMWLDVSPDRKWLVVNAGLFKL